MTSPDPPNLPCQDLIKGPRAEYMRIGIPLYEASIKCDWKAAKAILDNNPNIPLIRYSITDNGETPLHVAASAKLGPRIMKSFVKSLVDLMSEDDLQLQNKNYNTALYLAVVAGNIETIKIMMPEKKIDNIMTVDNRVLLNIPGGVGQDMMPLYAAALFGHHEVANYLYKYSNLRDDNWKPNRRRWLLEKCIENDMFDIAQQILEKHEDLACHGQALQILARKPDVFSVKKTNFFWSTIRIIIVWVLVFFGSKKKVPEKENKALPLLKIIWGAISQKPTKEIDTILRGAPDLFDKKDKSAAGRVAQVLQLQELISGHLDKLYDDTKEIMNGHPTTSTSQFTPLNALVSKHLVKMHLETQNIIKQDDKQVSNKRNQALQKLNISEQITGLHVETQKIAKSRYEMRDKALELQKLIKKYIAQMHDAINLKDTYSSRVLFLAAEMGNTIFLIELIRQYPDLIWKVNDNNQTIFHIAVKHRHKGIYNLLYEIGAMKDMITPLVDGQGNNMLHLVGKSAKQKRLQDVTGVALQMQQELLWFKEVENMVPPSYKERKNEDDLTPHELFTKEHKELRTHGEKWMKGTASQSMIVATLIATIVFAAAFTIPGGYNQTSGIPILKSKAIFMVFVVADAISLFSSSASILIFLSILTSRYAERDFLESLPRKLVFGLVTLFLSIATMTLAFSVSFFVLYYKGLVWIPIVIGVFAVIPVFLYMFLQFRLFRDIILSTYGSSHLFGPKKDGLYYKNPKV